MFGLRRRMSMSAICGAIVFERRERIQLEVFAAHAATRLRANQFLSKSSCKIKSASLKLVARWLLGTIYCGCRLSFFGATSRKEAIGILETAKEKTHMHLVTDLQQPLIVDGVNVAEASAGNQSAYPACRIIRRNDSVMSFGPGEISVASAKVLSAILGGLAAVSVRIREVFARFTEGVVALPVRRQGGSGVFQTEPIQIQVGMTSMCSGAYKRPGPFFFNRGNPRDRLPDGRRVQVRLTTYTRLASSGDKHA